MEISKYGFIVKGPGYSPDKNKAIMDSGFFHTTIIGVSSVDEACVAAKQLVDEGIQVLELCGGFGELLAQQVIESIDGKIPVGFVLFQKVEQEKLERFLKLNHGE